MMMRLDQFNNSWYRVGAPKWKQLMWYYINALVFKSYWMPFMGIKRALLRAFGAKVGKGVVIKPCVNIKYPWKISIGDHSWIGEEVWIDSLARVDIGAHCSVSQGAMMLTGNHNYRSMAFDLMVEPIVLEEGVWIGAKTVVCPGTICRAGAVLTVGSVAVKELLPNGIYKGNPAVWVKERTLK